MADPPDGDKDALQAEVARLRAKLERQTKDASAERERLTYELGHRVKNTLSVVQALAGQTLRGATAPESLDAFSDRIIALARANDAILRESWTTATLDATARSVLIVHGTAPGPLAIDGASLRIGASGALSFAMALHELATNAKRFGAWSTAGGRVDLRWTLPEMPKSPFELTWSEKGGPEPAASRPRGFGLRLVEQSLRSAFGRDVSLVFEPAGLLVRVRAPLEQVTATSVSS